MGLYSATVYTYWKNKMGVEHKYISKIVTLSVSIYIIGTTGKYIPSIRKKFIHRFVHWDISILLKVLIAVVSLKGFLNIVIDVHFDIAQRHASK